VARHLATQPKFDGLEVVRVAVRGKKLRQAAPPVAAELERLQRVGQGKNFVRQFGQAARQIEAVRARQ
jgi:hypothetical protein